MPKNSLSATTTSPHPTWTRTSMPFSQIWKPWATPAGVLPNSSRNLLYGKQLSTVQTPSHPAAQQPLFPNRSHPARNQSPAPNIEYERGRQPPFHQGTPYAFAKEMDTKAIAAAQGRFGVPVRPRSACRPHRQLAKCLSDRRKRRNQCHAGRRSSADLPRCRHVLRHGTATCRPHQECQPPFMGAFFQMQRGPIGPLCRMAGNARRRFSAACRPARLHPPP